MELSLRGVYAKKLPSKAGGHFRCRGILRLLSKLHLFLIAPASLLSTYDALHEPSKTSQKLPRLLPAVLTQTRQLCFEPFFPRTVSELAQKGFPAGFKVEVASLRERRRLFFRHRCRRESSANGDSLRRIAPRPSGVLEQGRSADVT